MGFMTGQKIYDNFTNGIGPEGLSTSAVMVNELAAEYLEEGDAIRRLTAKMESVWQGGAAGAALRGAGPLAVEHELAAPHMGTAQDLNSRQAGSFVDARNSVVPVPPQPTAPDPWAVFTSPGEVVPYRQEVADYNAANQHNVDVMTGYAGASSYNGKGMPQSYGALADDQAGIAIDAGTSDAGGPRDGGLESDDGSRDGGRGAVEWASRGSRWVASPPDTDGPASSDAGALPPVPQETTPDGFTQVPSGPVAVSTGGNLGSGSPSGGPGSGLVPGAGFVPVGGGPNDGSGGRDAHRSEARGPGGRAGGGEPPHGPGRAGGEPHGSGGRVGAGPLSGGASGEPHTGARGAGGAAGRSGVGGMPMAAGGRGRGEEDVERYAPDFLREDDPEGLFGADEVTAPPVIGEDLETPVPEPSNRAE